MPTRYTYREILASSAAIGAASAFSLVIGLARTKVMAVLLGPAGFGLMAVYTSISDLARSVAGMGINSSGVRQIADAVGSGDCERIARTATVLRRVALALGIVGAALLACFSGIVSKFTFGSDAHAIDISLLSFVLLLRLVADGQSALLQGMRRISELARLSVFGALLGTPFGLLAVYLLGMRGVVPSLVALAAASLFVSWQYSRKVEVPSPTMSARETRREVRDLLDLGFAFMASGFLTLGAAYAARTIVLRTIGLEAAGFYQAAWTLGGLYLGFVLQSLGTDFYPRLVAIARDHAECNRVVNEQAQASLLIGLPGALATITFAPLAISLLYTSDFHAAIELVRWITLGMTLRVISWPIGFIVIAKGARKIYLATEFAWTMANLVLCWYCTKLLGLNGAGIAFFGSYVFHILMMYPIVRYLTGFTWTAANGRLYALSLTAVAIVFFGFLILPSPWSTALGLAATVASTVNSARVLTRLACGAEPRTSAAQVLTRIIRHQAVRER